MTLQLIPNVHRATHRIGIEIARCPGVSVSQGEAHILAHLHEQGESSIAQLHAALAHKRSTLTSILDRLVERKLVTRVVDSKDRRSFRIKVTPAGARAAAKIHEYLEALEREALEGVSPAHLRAFTALIKKLAAVGKSAGTTSPA
jgi:DNA-binding MarR family transcriptional regulator